MNHDWGCTLSALCAKNKGFLKRTIKSFPKSTQIKRFSWIMNKCRFSRLSLKRHANLAAFWVYLFSLRMIYWLDLLIWRNMSKIWNPKKKFSVQLRSMLICMPAIFRRRFMVKILQNTLFRFCWNNLMNRYVRQKYRQSCL